MVLPKGRRHHCIFSSFFCCYTFWSTSGSKPGMGTVEYVQSTYSVFYVRLRYMLRSNLTLGVLAWLWEFQFSVHSVRITCLDLFYSAVLIILTELVRLIQHHVNVLSDANFYPYFLCTGIGMGVWSVIVVFVGFTLCLFIKRIEWIVYTGVCILYD